MTQGWVLRLEPTRLATLAPLRLEPGLELLRDDAAWWLRGPPADASLRRALQRLPALAHYALGEDASLVPAGARLPVGRLPAGDWRPLRELLQPASPPPALPARLDMQVPLRLVPARRERPAALLRCIAETWYPHALRASALRLRCWRFAADAGGRVLVRGLPLPGLPGTPYWEAEGVAIPCGFELAPGLPGAVVAELLELLPGELALFRPDASWERVPAGAFVPATRAALRASSAGTAAEPA